MINEMDSIHVVILWGIASLCALAAFIITLVARSKLTYGIMRVYLTWTTGSLFFIALNNLYTMLAVEGKWIENFGLGIYIPQYLFMAMGSLLFVIAAYQVYILSSIYGFKHEGEVMKKLLEEKIAKLDGK
ncbi:MAG: hypothetical protein QXJ68_07755 [Methanocellales archaeon]